MPMSTCRRSIIAVLAFALAALAFPATSFAASPTGSPSTPAAASGSATAPAVPANNAAFGIQPASATGVDSRTAFTFGATPGAKSTDHVALVNLGAQAVALQLYASDAISTSDGNFSLAVGDAKAKDVGSWVAIGGPPQITLPPRTSSGPSVTIVPFTLSVPANAASGDHAGGIVLALRTVAQPSSGQVKQNLDQRVGARVYVRVSGPIHPGLTVDGLHAEYGLDGTPVSPTTAGTMAVTYRVRNTGNVILGADQTATVSGWLGGGAKINGLSVIPPLLPGSSVLVRAQAKGVYPGIRLTAHVDLKPVVPVGAVDPGVQPSSAQVSVWAVPWPVLVIVLLALFGFGLVAWRRWGPHRPRGGRHTPTPRSETSEPVSVR